MCVLCFTFSFSTTYYSQLFLTKLSLIFARFCLRHITQILISLMASLFLWVDVTNHPHWRKEALLRLSSRIHTTFVLRNYLFLYGPVFLSYFFFLKKTKKYLRSSVVYSVAVFFFVSHIYYYYATWLLCHLAPWKSCLIKNISRPFKKSHLF